MFRCLNYVLKARFTYLRTESKIMPKPSNTQDKTPFQERREALGLSREKAAEMLDGISYERLYNIEHGKTAPTPDDILIMADAYKDPSLCNTFCSRQCRIGQRYVPHVEVGELPSITLGIIAALNKLDDMKNRLIEICADGGIDESEQADFNAIQANLEQLSLSVEALQLWTERVKKESKRCDNGETERN